MAKVLMLNWQNNMGDAICLMRGIKEWKEKHGHIVDFMSLHAMHLEGPWHTNKLFRNVRKVELEEFEILKDNYEKFDYDEMMVNFNMDWTKSTEIGIVNAYCLLNFGFLPSTDKPLFIPKVDELRNIEYITARLRGVGWKKLAFIQALSVSNPARSIPFDDIYEVCSLFPSDTLIMMPCGVHDPFHVTLNPFPKNVLAMPGFPVGHSAALMKYMDINVMVHGAYSHIGYAVDAPNMVQLNFYNTGSINFAIPGADNLNFPTNEDNYMPALKEAIDRILVG